MAPPPPGRAAARAVSLRRIRSLVVNSASLWTTAPRGAEASSGNASAERVRARGSPSSNAALSGPHRSTPRLTAAEKMRRSTAAARTVLCGTVIRCARALSAAPMDTIQRCMLRRAEQRGGPVPLVTRKVQESIKTTAERRAHGGRARADRVCE